MDSQGFQRHQSIENSLRQHQRVGVDQVPFCSSAEYDSTYVLRAEVARRTAGFASGPNLDISTEPAYIQQITFDISRVAQQPHTFMEEHGHQTGHPPSRKKNYGPARMNTTGQMRTSAFQPHNLKEVKETESAPTAG